MSRSGYYDNVDYDPLVYGRWRAQVRSAMRGKRGQSFLREMIAALDVMPEKVLIDENLTDQSGRVCAIGSVGKLRGIDMSELSSDDYDKIAATFGIAQQLVREIEYENDECGWNETPESRWLRMRKWVESNLTKG